MSSTGQRQPAAKGARKPASLPSIAGSEATETEIERLYLEHYQALVDYARGFVGGHDAQDIVHTVFSRILKRIPHWVDDENCRAKLFVAVRHEAVDLLRSRKRCDVVDPAQLQDIELVSPEANAGVNGELWRGWLVSMLDPAYSRVLLLRMNGLRVTEIAHTLGLPLGTAKWRLSVAIKKLKKAKEKANLFRFSNVV